MFTYEDLIWVKNVKRDRGLKWAYQEYKTGDIFQLDWPAGRNNMGKTDAGKAKINEVILLFQSVKNIEGYKRGTYLTHIVTPINNTTYTDLSKEHPFSRLVIIIGKNNTPIAKPTHLNFYKPNRGWLYDIDRIEPMKWLGKKFSKSQLQKQIWLLFKNILVDFSYVNEYINQSNFKIDNYQDRKKENSVNEGLRQLREGKHYYYERDSSIVRDLKREAESKGTLFCQVCNFDFNKKYGDIGKGFIECHHIVPISQGGQRKTTKEDLALVCSNCHRMLHRQIEKDKYHSINSLKESLNT